MPKARQSCAIGSPSRSCATNRRRSSITEHSFHGIHTSRFWEKPEGVTHVSGTNCHPCLGPLTLPRRHTRLDQALTGPILVPVEQHTSDAVFHAALAVARTFDSYIEGIALGPSVPDVIISDVGQLP